MIKLFLADIVEAGRHRFVLDTAALPAGTYLVRATTAGPRGAGQTYTEPFTVLN